MPEEEDNGPGAPDWIVTFTDMVSLLVTFFILLLTFSSLENYDVLQIPSFIPGSPGAIDSTSNPDIVEAPEVDLMAEMDPLRGADSPHSRPTEELSEDIAEMTQKQRKNDTPLDLSDVRDGLVIHYDARGTFAPGSTKLTPYLNKSLTELGRTLQHYSHMIVVEGHTDNAFQVTPRFPNSEALSITRAREAASALVGSSQLSPEMIQIAGLGSSQPLNANATAVDRSANRRVTVRILSMSQARADRVKRQAK